MDRRHDLWMIFTAQVDSCDKAELYGGRSPLAEQARARARDLRSKRPTDYHEIEDWITREQGVLNSLRAREENLRIKGSKVA